MKKKLLSLILTVVMTGVLAGCAEKAPAGAQSQTTGNGEMETGKMESAGDFSAAQNPDEWPTITIQVPVLSEMADEQMEYFKSEEYVDDLLNHKIHIYDIPFPTR